MSGNRTAKPVGLPFQNITCELVDNRAAAWTPRRSMCPAAAAQVSESEKSAVNTNGWPTGWPTVELMGEKSTIWGPAPGNTQTVSVAELACPWWSDTVSVTE